MWVRTPRKTEVRHCEIVPLPLSIVLSLAHSSAVQEPDPENPEVRLLLQYSIDGSQGDFNDREAVTRLEIWETFFDTECLRDEDTKNSMLVCGQQQAWILLDRLDYCSQFLVHILLVENYMFSLFFMPFTIPLPEVEKKYISPPCWWLNWSCDFLCPT